MSTELIVAAAIKYRNLVCVIEQPGRHHDVFGELDALKVRRLNGGVQGFITSTGRFVEREEARKLAEAADQLIQTPGPDGVPCVREHRHLFSEDVW